MFKLLEVSFHIIFIAGIGDGSHFVFVILNGSSFWVWVFKINKFRNNLLT